MIKNLRYIIPLFLVIFSLLPAMTSAHIPPIFPTGYWGGPDPTNNDRPGIVSCNPYINIQRVGTSSVPVENTNSPCVSLCDLIHTLIHLIGLGISLTLYAASPILFAWGGILILISTGNASRISEGKKIVTGTLIGVLIILTAYLIVRTLIQTLGVTLIPMGFDCVVQ